MIEDIEVRMSKQGEAFLRIGRIPGDGLRTEEAWIPRIMVRRQTEVNPLASTFVSIIEPYEGTSNIAQIRRLPLETSDGVAYPEPNVAVEIQLANGHRVLFVAADVENPPGLSPSRLEHKVMVQKEWGLRLDGEMCMVRLDATGKVRRIVLCRGNSVSIGDVALKLKRDTYFLEAKLNYERNIVRSSKLQFALLDDAGGTSRIAGLEACYSALSLLLPTISQIKSQIPIRGARVGCAGIKPAATFWIGTKSKNFCLSSDTG